MASLASGNSSSTKTNNNKTSGEQEMLNTLRENSKKGPSTPIEKILYPEDDVHEETELNNDLIIEQFRNAYSKKSVKEEGKRKEAVTTDEQGKYSGVQKKQSIEGDIDFFHLLAQEFSDEPKKLPKIINIHEVVKYFNTPEHGMSRGEILVKLSKIYCYFSGCLLSKEGYIQKLIDLNPKKITIITGKKGARAEIEHIIAWRLMLKIAAHLPGGNRDFINGMREVVGSFIRNENLLNTEKGVEQLKKFQSIIKNFGGSVTAYTSLYPRITNAYFNKLLIDEPGDALGLIINMERIRWHGMWYSIRLFNMIKSNMAIIKIVTNGNKLRFEPSVSRIKMIIDIMFLHVFDENDKLYDDKEAYNKAIGQIKKGAEQLFNRQRDDEEKIMKDQDKTTSGNKYHYDTENAANHSFTNESEFEFFRDMIDNMQKKEKNINEMKKHFLENTVQVTGYLCEQLNRYKYKRFKLLRQTNELTKKSKGLGKKKVLEKGKETSKNAASHESPFKNKNTRLRTIKTLDRRTAYMRRTDSKAKETMPRRNINIDTVEETSSSTNNENPTAVGNRNSDTGSPARKKSARGGRKRTRRRRKRKRKRTRRKKHKKKRSKKSSKKKRTRRRR